MITKELSAVFVLQPKSALMQLYGSVLKDGSWIAWVLIL